MCQGIVVKFVGGEIRVGGCSVADGDFDAIIRCTRYCNLAPCALVNAAVGLHLHGVGGIGHKAGEGISVPGHMLGFGSGFRNFKLTGDAEIIDEQVVLVVICVSKGDVTHGSLKTA